MIPIDLQYIIDSGKIAENPAALATVVDIYNAYHSKKQKFIAALKGQKSNRVSIIANMTPKESREFQKALSKIKKKRLRICRLGRGPRAIHGVRSYGSYLPLPLAKTVSVYAYPKYF